MLNLSKRESRYSPKLLRFCGGKRSRGDLRSSFNVGEKVSVGVDGGEEVLGSPEEATLGTVLVIVEGMVIHGLVEIEVEMSKTPSSSTRDLVKGAGQNNLPDGSQQAWIEASLNQMTRTIRCIEEQE